MRSALIASLGLDPKKLLDSFGTAATIGLFAVVFAESGIMIGFFLPGDSLLFAAGLLSGSPSTHLAPLWVLLIGCAVAAVAGDQVGYVFGHKLGPALFRRPDSRIFKQKYLVQTEEFFGRHGSKAIILARFVPIVRTFTPIVAGASKMHYRTFVMYNVIGGIGWSSLMLLLGWKLGNTFPAIGKNLDLALVVIVFVSLLPVAFEYLRHRRRAAAADDLV